MSHSEALVAHRVERAITALSGVLTLAEGITDAERDDAFRTRRTLRRAQEQREEAAHTASRNAERRSSACTEPGDIPTWRTT